MVRAGRKGVLVVEPDRTVHDRWEGRRVTLGPDFDPVDRRPSREREAEGRGAEVVHRVAEQRRCRRARAVIRGHVVRVLPGGGADRDLIRPDPGDLPPRIRHQTIVAAKASSTARSPAVSPGVKLTTVKEPSALIVSIARRPVTASFGSALMI